jgi:hypothetical protein
VPASVIRRANPLGETTTKARPGPSPVTCTAWQVQLLRRPNEQSEPVVGQGGLIEFKGGLRSAAHRLQADPPQPIAPRGRLERDDLDSRGPIGPPGCGSNCRITCIPPY